MATTAIAKVEIDARAIAVAVAIVAVTVLTNSVVTTAVMPVTVVTMAIVTLAIAPVPVAVICRFDGRCCGGKLDANCARRGRGRLCGGSTAVNSERQSGANDWFEHQIIRLFDSTRYSPHPYNAFKAIFRLLAREKGVVN